jgi:hypothetical protein
VPVGGGKDSIVTIECLKRGGEPLILFSLGDAERSLPASRRRNGLHQSSSPAGWRPLSSTGWSAERSRSDYRILSAIAWPAL